MIAEGFEDLSSNMVNKYPTYDLSHVSTKTQLLNKALKRNRINTFNMDRRNYTVKKLINFTLRPTISTGINSSNIRWVRFGKMRNPYKTFTGKALC
jgi:hypothetical protein